MKESIAKNFEIIADAVYEKGKKDEYDKFWDIVQQNGERTYYYQAFLGTCYNFDNFYPKYDIKVVGSGQNFMYNWRTGMGQTNTNNTFYSLKTRLEECGVSLDTSEATSLINAFSYGPFTELPTIDVTGITAASGAIFAYNYEYLKTIEKIKISENTVISTSWFAEDRGLENLTIEGTIGQSNFSVKDCKKLTKESLLSILKALSLDITETKTITFSTEHQTTVTTDPDCKPYYDAAKTAGWSFAFA